MREAVIIDHDELAIALHVLGPKEVQVVVSQSAENVGRAFDLLAAEEVLNALHEAVERLILIIKVFLREA